MIRKDTECRGLHICLLLEKGVQAHIPVDWVLRSRAGKGIIAALKVFL